MSADTADPEGPDDLEPAEQPVPMGRRRKRFRRILLAFLAFQLIVPLTYYLRDDPYDERFAWRMFSAIRLHACQPFASEVTEDGERPVDLPRVIHQAWINTMARNREDVIRAFMAKRCEEEGVEEVTLTNRCRTPAQTMLAPQIYRRDCSSGEEELPEELIIEDDD